MEWLALAMVPPLVWAVASICDKVLASRFLKDGIAAGVATNLASGLFPLLLVPLFPLAPLMPQEVIILLASGVLWGLARLFYCIAIEKEEASRVVPFLQLSPVIILLASTLLLGESLGLLQAFAFLLVLSGALWVSVRKIRGGLHVSEALWPLVGNNLSLAAAILLLKGAAHVHWWTALVVLNVGFALSAIPGLIRGDTRAALRRSRAAVPIAVLLAIASLTLIGRAAFFGALKGAPAAIVTVLSSTQTVFVLFFATAMTIYFPHVIREEVSPRILLNKGSAIGVILLGIALLFFA